MFRPEIVIPCGVWCVVSLLSHLKCCIDIQQDFDSMEETNPLCLLGHVHPKSLIEVILSTSILWNMECKPNQSIAF
jgi:hypothetical protein